MLYFAAHGVLSMPDQVPVTNTVEYVKIIFLICLQMGLNNYILLEIGNAVQHTFLSK